MEEKTRRRAQFLLTEILTEMRNALRHLYETRPRIFRRELERVVLNARSWEEVHAKLNQAIDLVSEPNEITWDVLEVVGLSGNMLEWKADLFFLTVGRPKPAEQTGRERNLARPTLTYPEGKPVWRRLFRFAKSLLDSLIKGVSENSKLRFVLDFVKEYIEAIEASVRFIRGPQETGE